MELGNIYIYTGPEQMKCLTLAEDSFAKKEILLKAKANDKVVRLLVNEQPSVLRSSSLRAHLTWSYLSGQVMFAILETQLNTDQLWRLGTDRCAGRQHRWHSYLATLSFQKYFM